jgi:hypothetical protein
MNPLLPASLTPYPAGVQAVRPQLWFWSWVTAQLSTGGELVIPEASGSGAARVFDYMRYVDENTAERWPGRPRLRFIVWLGGGVSWNCGSCFAHQLGFQLNTWFGGQIWLNGGLDEEYWADAVTAHELGHWAMASFGHEVGEGGSHTIGLPTTPGLAWSEGWATWFSSDVRRDPVYFDKQQGTAFWFDVGVRSASSSPWPRPVAALGLYQNLYENEVSAMMWNLSTTQGLGSAPLDAALASVRMTVPPFLRGYVTPLGIQTTFFADFLDALACGGLGASALDAATDPLVHYPYPSQSPLCRSPGPPATLRVEKVSGELARGAHVALRATLQRTGPWSMPVSFSFQVPSPAIVTRAAGAAPTWPTDSDSAELELDLAEVPEGDAVLVADSRSPAAGFHAEARYRFGRPEPIPRAPRTVGPRLRLGPLDLGSAIPGTVR